MLAVAKSFCPDSRFHIVKLGVCDAQYVVGLDVKVGFEMVEGVLKVFQVGFV